MAKSRKQNDEDLEDKFEEDDFEDGDDDFDESKESVGKKEGLKNNQQKLDYLLSLWYEETFDNEFIGKLNLDKNKFVKQTKPGTFADYSQHISQKAYPRISKTEIHLSEQEKTLQIIFWYNTGCFDSSNFQNGLMEGLDRNYDLKKSIQGFKKEDGKIVVMMTGNLIGKEWEFKHLKDAFSKIAVEWQEDGSAERVIRRIFFGLKKRKQRVINDIRFALKCGADEVYIMKGPEEFAVLKKTNYDIVEDIVKSVNDPRLKYIEEGTETKLNFVKENGEGKESYYTTIKLKHLNPSTSANPAVMETGDTSKKASKATVEFILGGNYTGSLNHTDEFYPSGQLTFRNTQKAKNPEFMYNDGNTFKLYVEGNDNVTVVKGGQNIYDPNLPIYQKIFNEKKQLKIQAKLVDEKLKQKLQKLEQKQIKLSKGREL